VRRSLHGRDCEGLGAAPERLRACSACAGDYEDPDRTAWPFEVENEEGEVEMEAAEEEGTATEREIDMHTSHTAWAGMPEAAREDGESGVADEFPAKET